MVLHWWGTPEVKPGLRLGPNGLQRCLSRPLSKAAKLSVNQCVALALQGRHLRKCLQAYSDKINNLFLLAVSTQDTVVPTATSFTTALSGTDRAAITAVIPYPAIPSSYFIQVSPDACVAVRYPVSDSFTVTRSLYAQFTSSNARSDKHRNGYGSCTRML